MDTALIIISLLVGAILPFISEWLNKLFKADGKKALVVAGLLSAVVAFGVLIFTGGLKTADLTLANVLPVFTAIFSVSQIVFQLIKEKMGWNVVRDPNSL